MSVNRLKENENYLKLLLSTSNQQQKALLETITDKQVDLLTEVIYNLLHVVPIPSRERNSLLRKKILKELAKVTRSHKYRHMRVRVNKKLIVDTLLRYSDQLLNTVEGVRSGRK